MNLPMRSLPKFPNLPNYLPIEGAVRIELEEGVPIFRASSAIQSRIEELLCLQQEIPLSREQTQELDTYEEMDDYLSLVNRTVRNLFFSRERAN